MRIADPEALPHISIHTTRVALSLSLSLSLCLSLSLFHTHTFCHRVVWCCMAAALALFLAPQSVLALTPTLINDLMFHDLVFGHDLGSGSFSCVKYAKRIIRGKAASMWPEYAVKVISTEMIKRLGTTGAHLGHSQTDTRLICGLSVQLTD